MNYYKPDPYMHHPCPKCRQLLVRELYGGWHPSEFATEVYLYVCDKCGVLGRKEYYLFRGWFKYIDYLKNETRVY